MVLTMARPFKHPKTGVYWFRRRVPADLKAALGGKSEVTKTLGTKDPSEARIQFASVAEDVSRQWANLRSLPAPLPLAMVLVLAGEAYDEYARVSPQEPGEPEIWRHVLRLHADAERGPVGGLSILAEGAGLERWLGETVDAILARHGIRTDDASRSRLLREANKAMVQAARTRLRHAKGDFRPDPDADRFPKLADITAAAPPLSLLGLFDSYAAERGLPANTSRTWRGYVVEFVAFLGHDDAARVTKADVVRWKDKLVSHGRLSARSINMGRLTVLKTALKWAESNTHLAANPAHGVRVASKKTASPPVRGYDDQEAATLLRAARLETSPSLRWLPWLCAVTGARIAELANLRGQDVKRQGDIWTIRFSPVAGPLKTPLSARTIPMHPALVTEGFPAVASAAGDSPIFADLWETGGHRGAAASHVVGRWVRKKLAMADVAISPAHSWRHRFRTLGHRYGMSEAAIDAVEGHAPRTQGQRYGERPIELMRELEKLPHPLPDADSPQ